MKDRKAAFFSLSQTQRRLAHEYKRLALDAKDDGRMVNFEKFKAESDRLWNASKWNLQAARRAAK